MLPVPGARSFRPSPAALRVTRWSSTAIDDQDDLVFTAAQWRSYLSPSDGIPLDVKPRPCFCQALRLVVRGASIMTAFSPNSCGRLRPLSATTSIIRGR
jgi:hypothetical protein